MIISHPSGQFTLHKVFSRVICLGLEFGVFQDPGVGLGGLFVLRKMLGTSRENYAQHPDPQSGKDIEAPISKDDSWESISARLLAKKISRFTADDTFICAVNIFSTRKMPFTRTSLS